MNEQNKELHIEVLNLSKSKLIVKCLTVSLLLGLLLPVLLNMPIFLVKNVNAFPEATLKIAPSQTTVGNTNEPVPAAGYPFTIDITVSNVTDLYAWQIQLYYLPSVLNFTSATLPSGHVFEGRDITPYGPYQEIDTRDLTKNLTAVNLANPENTLWRWSTAETLNLTRWFDSDNSGGLSVSDIVWLTRTPAVEPSISPYRVKTMTSAGSTISLTVEIGFAYYGATLMGEVPSFNGSGVLGQMSFKGIGVGGSFLNFSRGVVPMGVGTFLLDSNLADIPFELVDGKVTVLGIAAGAQPSEITIDVSPATVQVGSNVTITGTITPTKTNVDVTISYRREGTTAWTTLKTVKTDSQSRYTYQWKTNQTGTYELKASWQGDAGTAADESDIKKVTVSEQPTTDFTTYLPYIIGAIAIVVVVVVVVYFLKMRKK